MPELLEYKCPCCGGGITFNSASQKMKCPYCDTEFALETLQHYDAELHSDASGDMEWTPADTQDWTSAEDDGLRVYICQSCGGEVVAPETTAASSCPFCGNPVVMKGNLSGALRPDLVIPFKLDKEAAKASLASFYKGKKLLPRVFSRENHIDEIKGIYVPFWLFSCEADADIRYKATRTRAWSDWRYNYVETSHYLVTRSGSLAFDMVPVDGSSSIDNDIMESIEPFDLSEAVDFQTAYLSGFFADKYDVTSEECIPRANERVKASTESAFMSTVSGYATVMPEESHVSCRQGKVKYGLLPVWLLTTNWNGQKYLFAMNGQTGKFIGDLPVDKGAVWKYFGIIAAAVAAGCFALSMFLL